MELQHFSHEHALFLIDHEDDGERIRRCQCCKDLVSSLAFSCKECNYFHLHKHCAELPTEIKHPLHRKHFLTLQKMWPRTYSGRHDPKCSLCLTSDRTDFIYGCYDCRFYLDIKCAFLPQCLLQPESVHHYARFNRPGPFTCDACGGHGSLVHALLLDFSVGSSSRLSFDSSPYICTTCHIIFHKDCRSLPRTINVLQHHHCINHSYFLIETEMPIASNCAFCHEHVDKEVGSYSCSIGGCNFLVHVRCGLEQNDFGKAVLREEKDLESIFSAGEINCELKKDQLPIEIKHSSHQHKLLLGDDDGDETKEKCCDGCIRPISTPFYRCVDCDFNLHKTCIELPLKVHLFHKHPLTLLPQAPLEMYENGIFWCQVCCHPSHDFLYWCNVCKVGVDLRCISVPYKFSHNGHEHPLFLTFLPRRQLVNCSACGDRPSYFAKFLVRCKVCRFVLDYSCATLPKTVKHRYDDHPFLLTCQPIDDGYDEYYCDICEEERDPNHWFYYCPKCDHSAHTKCVLRKYPNLKLGSQYIKKDMHPHALIFVWRHCVGHRPPCDLGIRQQVF